MRAEEGDWEVYVGVAEPVENYSPISRAYLV